MILYSFWIESCCIKILSIPEILSRQWKQFYKSMFVYETFSLLQVKILQKSILLLLVFTWKFPLFDLLQEMFVKSIAYKYCPNAMLFNRWDVLPIHLVYSAWYQQRLKFAHILHIIYVYKKTIPWHVRFCFCQVFVWFSSCNKLPKSSQNFAKW